MNTPMVRTTITLPQNLYKLLKMRAVVENTNVSNWLVQAAEKELYKKEIQIKVKKQPKAQPQDPMKTLGTLNLGIKTKQIYKSRDELYDDHIRRKMGYR